MAGLDPAILPNRVAAKTWMPGSSPGMTSVEKAEFVDGHPHFRTPACAGGLAPAKNLEVLGHHAVGSVHLRRNVCRPTRGVRLFRPAKDRAARLFPGRPAGCDRAEYLALGHDGLTGGRRRLLGRDQADAHVLCRLSGAALDVLEERR